MKKLLLAGLLVVAGVGATTRSSAQDAFTAAARQETEARLKRLEAELEDMRAGNLRQLQKIDILETALRKTVNELATSKFATVDDIAKLAEAVRELDHKREADKQLVLQKFEEIRKIVATAPAIPPSPPKNDGGGKAGKSQVKTTPHEPDHGSDQKGVFHSVEKSQTLLEIIKAYNDDLKAKGKPGKITLQQVLDANKGLDPSRMKVGQKVFIPLPQ